jgi:hypothetical protein
MHSTEYPDFYGMLPDGQANDRSFRMFAEWAQWPFEPPLYDGGHEGCMACAWAWWYHIDEIGLDPCGGPGQSGTNVYCAYEGAYTTWIAGELPLQNTQRTMRYGSREQQRDREDYNRRERRSLIIPDVVQTTTLSSNDIREALEALEEDTEWPGCAACLQYAQDGGSEDPCSWARRGRDIDRPNPRCNYWPWWRENYTPVDDERAIRRRGDYPQPYRSRYGRGECIMRDRAGQCPRGCPCRTNYTAEEVLRRTLRVETFYDDEENMRCIAYVRGVEDDQLTEVAQYTWDSFENARYSLRMQNTHDATLRAYMAREGVTA